MLKQVAHLIRQYVDVLHIGVKAFALLFHSSPSIPPDTFTRSDFNVSTINLFNSKTSMSEIASLSHLTKQLT